jgi:regulator of replication initiation timing
MVKISFTLEEQQEFWNELNNFPEKISKKELSEMAKNGNMIAGYLLMKNHLEAIFNEAMNPLTREEIAIEMLGELLISPIFEIRKKAFDLLKKIQPEKISEKLNDERFDAELKGKVLEMIFSDNEMPLNILIELLTVKNLEDNISQKLVEYLQGIRKQVGDITEEAIKLQAEMKGLKERLDERIHTIESFFNQIARYGENYPANPKVLQDLKLDIEMAYSSLKESKE